MDLAAAFAALNQAERRCNELLAEMRAERQLIREQLAAARSEINGSIKTILEAAVKEQVDQLGKETRQAMDRATDKVSKEIDRYLELALGQDAYSKFIGRKPIPDLIRERREEGRL